MRPALWAVVAMVALVVAACGGASDQATPSPSPSSATPTTTITATPTRTATSPAATPTPTSSPTTAPTATPTPTSTPVPPTPMLSPTPSPTDEPAAGVILEHGDRESAMVALTFDIGGRVEPALAIMAWLIEHEVHATIFVTGAILTTPNTDAGREVLGLVVAHPDLFRVGNHSQTHPDFRDLSTEERRRELERTEAAIAAHSDLDGRPYFRPPFGGQDASVVADVAAAGYPYTVMWDVDTIDWRPEADGGPTADAIVAKVSANVQGGSIVLMHLGGYNTLEALPGILAAVEAKGLTPATLDELLR